MEEVSELFKEAFRKCKCTAFCIAITNDNTYVLVNKLEGNVWRCPTKYLDIETAKQCSSRAVYEDSGIEFDEKYFDLLEVTTDPNIDEDVCLKHVLIYTDSKLPEIDMSTVYAYNGHDIEETRWMPVKTMRAHTWMNKHDKTVEEIITMILHNSHKK